jgi:FkbM family methyltransferase
MSIIKRAFKRNSHNVIFKLIADFGKAINKIYENSNHDIDCNGELTVLEKISKFSPSIIIDGGANIGKYSLLANQLSPHCKIYSLEPVESTYQKLINSTKNIKNIIPIQKGLFSENCTKEINIFSSHTHSSLSDIERITDKPIAVQKIDLVAGDNLLLENKIDTIDFLKIDIEGAEYDALLGFKKSIKEGKIKAIQFEYGPLNIHTKKLLIDYYQFFEKNGYTVGKIFPKIVEFRIYKYKYEDFLSSNFIAVKNSEIELKNSLSSR